MKIKLQFGDTIMAILGAALLGLSLLCAPGCALFNSSATSEQKIADVRALSRAAASIGSQEALIQNPAWLPRFLTVKAQLEKLIADGTVTGALLRDVIASLPVNELKSPQAKIAIDSVTVLFDSTLGSKVNIEQAPYVQAAASGILDGLRDTLGK